MEEVIQLLIQLNKNLILANKEVLTLQDAAAYTGYSESTLYSMINRNEITYYKPNKDRRSKVFFKKSDLDDFLTANKVSSDYDLIIKANANRY